MDYNSKVVNYGSVTKPCYIIIWQTEIKHRYDFELDKDIFLCCLQTGGYTIADKEEIFRRHIFMSII